MGNGVVVASAVLTIVGEVFSRPVLAVEATDLTLWYVILQKNVTVGGDTAGLACTASSAAVWIVWFTVGKLLIAQISLLAIAIRCIEGFIAIGGAGISWDVMAVIRTEVVAIGSSDHHLKLAPILTLIGRGLCSEIRAP